MSSAYLDNNATTAVAADVLEAMLPYFRAQPGNPSSLHGPGEAAFAAISEARRHVARLLDAPRPEGITFTGSATEATNMAAHAARLRGRQTAITSTVEHAATQNSFASRFAHVHAIGVDRDGHLDEAAALQQIKTCGDDLALV